jgi:hypothetical protein
MLFAEAVFKIGKLEIAARYLMIVSGVLSLIGLFGVPLAIMKVGYWLTVRNIGIVGYAFGSLGVFLLMGMVFGRTRQVAEEVRRK